MFIQMGIRYGSKESLDLIDKIGSQFIDVAMNESALMAKEDGAFPLMNKEAILKSPFYNHNASSETKELVEKYGLRNSQLTTIAPTGSISTLIGCSNGVEPMFRASYTRKTESLNSGQETYYTVVTPIVEELMSAKGIKDIADLPDYVVTAETLEYKDRIDVQATWQQYIDASISSTVNVPNEFTVEEVEQLYMYAWEKGLKGTTIYRDGCERSGILITDKKDSAIGDQIKALQEQIDDLVLGSLKEDPNKCPMCGGEMVHSGGCTECQDCGYSPCAI